MNDKDFDERSAREWMEGIESRRSAIRDEDIYPRLKAWAERHNPQSILEVGCGQGVCSAQLDLAHRTYTGVEPSRFLLVRANELYRTPKRKFISGNAYDLPLLDASFDAAFSVMVWHLLGNLPAAASEMSRVLKPGKSFFVVTANPEGYSAWETLYTNIKKDGQRFEGDMCIDGKQGSHDVLYLHRQEDIEASLKRAGLQLLSQETFRSGLYVAFEGRKLATT